jgi:hypothetical protein
LVLFEAAALANEQERRFVLFDKSSDMGAVKVNLSGTPGGGNLEHGQFILPVEEGDTGGDFRFGALLAFIRRHSCL